MGRIYMIGAMKGGVGKSVTAFNLAYSLKKRGKKVLAVDFDPQSNLTTCFGVEDADVTVSDLMLAVLEEGRIYLGEKWRGHYPIIHRAFCSGGKASDGDGHGEDAGGHSGAAAG